MKILAVEDEPEYLEMLQMVMASLGHSLIIARNGVEGIRMAEKEKIDVILSDVAMPSMDGVEFHKKIRATLNHKETPFIFLTGVASLKKVQSECTTPKDMLLQKPVSVDRLLEIFSGQIKDQP